MKFWLPGGSFFNDFSTLKISLYTPPTKLWRYTDFTIAVCLSVHLSVRLWKSGFCTITPLPFDIQWWYFTYMLTLTRGGPLLIMGQKVKCQIWTLNLFTVSAPQFHLLLAYNNDTSQMYWPRPEKDLYCFWGQKIKGQGHIWSLNFVSFPHGDPISFWHTMMIWWGQEVKGKGCICVYFVFELLIVSVSLLYYLLTYNYDTSHMCFLWTEEDLY